ncbi:MAG: hypothetical protein K1X42_17620 [Opitutaceae bacterium]|nr:hypothetical protein [Opitutaceae bacterium]
MTPLGYESAKRAVELGRGHFLGAPDADLPRGKTPRGRSPIVAADDLIPQFGYVGAQFARSKVLLLGINPGNGDDVKRSHQDDKMMPALHRFAVDLSVASFKEAQCGYKSVCQSWWIWQRYCSEVIGAGKLTLEDIAYSNALPWRTHSESNFDDAVGKAAATSYAYPLIEELRPKVIVAMGKKAAKILSLGGRSFPNLIVWNRAQVATPSVQQERAAAAKQVFVLIGRKAS